MGETRIWKQDSKSLRFGTHNLKTMEKCVMLNTLSDFYNIIKGNSMYIDEKKNLIIYNQEKLKRIIGITSNGEWFVEIDTQFYLLKEFKQYYKLISILEIPFERIEREINERFIKLEIIFDVRYIFPFYPIIESVFRNPNSLYWLELAYLWYEKLDDEQKYELIPIMQDLSRNLKLSQKLRHKIARNISELKKYR